MRAQSAGFDPNSIPETFDAPTGAGTIASSIGALDDRKKPITIVNEPSYQPLTPYGAAQTSGIAPIPSTPLSAYQSTYANGHSSVYQPGQQFQIYDSPHAAQPGLPVSYSTIEEPTLSPGTIVPDCIDYSSELWHWQLMPAGLIWHSYLAGSKEPRLSAVFVSDTGVDTKFDGTVGGRVGLLRYGDSSDFRPQGWELDIEGAAFIRQDLTQDSDVDGYDFRVGIPITYGYGPFQVKLSWYHTSSHLGDEYELKHPTISRINYSRNAVVWGLSYFPVESIRLYGEVDYGYWTDGGNLPWAFQFGWEYSPVVRGWHGAPFAAMNVYMRQENDFGGPFTFETGWQWRPLHGGQMIRLGFDYQNGPSNFDQFYKDSEQLIGFGLWYDY